MFETAGPKEGVKWNGGFERDEIQIFTGDFLVTINILKPSRYENTPPVLQRDSKKQSLLWY
jgi:hypothetical protein